MNTTTTSLINDIGKGVYDADLKTIAEYIRFREKHIAPQAYQFRVGQRVWFNEKVRPTYLVGVSATITKINNTRVKLRLDDRTYEWHIGRHKKKAEEYILGRFGTGDIACPPNLLTMTEPK
jgi:hypothetical protein